MFFVPQNENLNRRVDHLTTMLGHKRQMENELEELRPLRHALQVLDQDLLAEPAETGALLSPSVDGHGASGGEGKSC